MNEKESNWKMQFYHTLQNSYSVKKIMKKLFKLYKKQMPEAWDGHAKLQRNCVYRTQLSKKLEIINNFKGPE